MPRTCVGRRLRTYARPSFRQDAAGTRDTLRQLRDARPPSTILFQQYTHDYRTHRTVCPRSNWGNTGFGWFTRKGLTSRNGTR